MRSSRLRASSAPGISSRSCASRPRRSASSRPAGATASRRSWRISWTLGGMTSLRSALYPLRLVGARLGSRSAPVVLVVLGIAAGASVVVGGRAGALVAQDRAVAQAVERIPDGRGRCGRSGSAFPGRATSRSRFSTAGHGPRSDTWSPSHARPHSSSSARARSGARSPASEASRARDAGDPPLWPAAAECRPERCEVLRLRGSGRLPQPEGLKLVEVGTGALENRVLFGDFLAPTDNALDAAEVSPSLARAAGYHRPPPPPLFLAEGVDVLAGAPALDAPTAAMPG